MTDLQKATQKGRIPTPETESLIEILLKRMGFLSAQEKKFKARI